MGAIATKPGEFPPPIATGGGPIEDAVVILRPTGDQNTANFPAVTQNLLRAWIDPARLHLVEMLSSPSREGHVEGLRVLADLCRMAFQPHLFTSDEIPPLTEFEIDNIAKSCKRSRNRNDCPVWSYGRETTLKWLVLFEAIKIINKFRRKRKTVIQIPLGEQPPLNEEELLERLDLYLVEYKNGKTRELLLRAREDIKRYGIPTLSGEKEEPRLLELRLQLQETLICKLGEVGVPRKMRRKLALWFTTQPLHLLIKGYLGAMEATRERHVLPGSFEEECSSLSLHYTCVLEKEAENTQIPSESSTENRDRHDETPQGAPSLSCQNASFSGQDSESEKQPLQDDQAWNGPSSEVLDDVSDDLEARRLIFVLDGPEYLDDAFLASEDGQRLYRGYLAKVKQRRPEIVRISAINALLQKDWPVWKGNKRDARLEKVGAWFHSSYDRYVDQTRPLKPTGEIASWTVSPYSLEEIAMILPLERRRQDMDWTTPHAVRRPLPGCVEKYDYLTQIYGDGGALHECETAEPWNQANEVGGGDEVQEQVAQMAFSEEESLTEAAPGSPFVLGSDAYSDEVEGNDQGLHAYAPEYWCSGPVERLPEGTLTRGLADTLARRIRRQARAYAPQVRCFPVQTALGGAYAYEIQVWLQRTGEVINVARVKEWEEFWFSRTGAIPGAVEEEEDRVEVSAAIGIPEPVVKWWTTKLSEMLRENHYVSVLPHPQDARRCLLQVFSGSDETDSVVLYSPAQVKAFLQRYTQGEEGKGRLECFLLERSPEDGDTVLEASEGDTVTWNSETER